MTATDVSHTAAGLELGVTPSSAGSHSETRLVL